MKIPNKKLLFYFVLFLLLAFSLYLHFFLDPTLKETHMILRDISVIQNSARIAENKKIELKSILEDRDQLQITILEKKLKLPEQLDSHDLIYLLLDANSSRLERHSIIFLEPILRQDFKVIPVRFSFSTDNYGLSEFLSGLEKLQNRPTISYMQISAAKTENNDLNKIDKNTKIRYNLEVEMTLNFFVRGIEE